VSEPASPSPRPCPKARPRPVDEAAAIATRRRSLAVLFDRGQAEAAARHRLAVCCAASDCGRICRWLVKGPGIADAYCMHPAQPADQARRPIYAALADPAFACPAGLF